MSKPFLMMNITNAQEAASNYPAPEDEQKMKIELHENVMFQYKSMGVQALKRMSQINLQVNVLNEEREHLINVYKELYSHHENHKKEWEKITSTLSSKNLKEK